MEVRASESRGGGARPLPRRGTWWVRGALALALIALFAGIVELATQEPDRALIEVNGIGDAQRIFGGIPQEGIELGDSDAPVTVSLFDDLQCPDCADHFLGTVPRLVDDLVRSGEVRLSYYNYSFSSSEQERGFFGAEAAGEQGYQWQYAYLFFRNQDQFEERTAPAQFDRVMEALAGATSELDVPEWEDNLERGLEEGSAIQRRLDASERLGQELGVRAEPAVFIDGPSGNRLLQDSPSASQIEAAVEAVR
jgi:protein-disulfide isomerase